MGNFYGIDPGSARSAMARVGDDGSIEAVLVENSRLLAVIRSGELHGECAIEKMVCYSQRVGQEVFETCMWTGAFMAAFQWSSGYCRRVPRKTVCWHVCNSPHAKDADVRRALIDRYGPVGTKKNPGPTREITKDMWSALAVATWLRDGHRLLVEDETKGLHYFDQTPLETL